MTASITNITFGNYVAYEGLSEGQWVMSVSIQDSTGATNTYNITRDVIGDLQYDCGVALEQSPYPSPIEAAMDPLANVPQP